MKSGNRGAGDSNGDPGAGAGDVPPVPSEPPPVTEVQPAAEQETPGSPAGEELPVVHVEPVVEGEAYEIPPDEPPKSLTVHQRQPDGSSQSQPAPAAAAGRPAPPPPVGEQPVTVATPGPAPAPVTSLGDSGEAFASGHAKESSPSWQEPVRKTAGERPELVVAAAFAGGLLAAMILRRLGN